MENIVENGEAKVSEVSTPLLSFERTKGQDEIVVEEQSQLQAQPHKPKTTLDRAQLSRTRTFCFCAFFVVIDSVKQVLSYSVSYYNSDVYPLPQTLIVLLIELVKLLLVAFSLLKNDAFSQLKFSLMFAVPAVVYSINNNLYFFALHYTTPPVWLILIQSRVILTALVYRFIFSRPITKLQWFALAVLISSIIMTKLADSPFFSTLFATEADSVGGNVLLPRSSSMAASGKLTPSSLPAATQTVSSLTVAIVLSIISATLSVFASVFTEYLFKNDKRSFTEQQFQIYFFSSIISGLFTIASEIKSPVIVKGMEMPSTFIIVLLVLVILVSSLGGIAVANIVKMLDNIVKIYLSTLANILNSIMCWLLFPSRFTLSSTFIVSLSMVFIAIYLYEKKTLSVAGLRQSTGLSAVLDHPCVTACRAYCDRTIAKYVFLPLLGLAVGTLLGVLFATYVLHYDLFVDQSVL